MSALLDLLQLADSAFPTGAFAHSYGLESLVQEGMLGRMLDGVPQGAEEALADLLHARLALEIGCTDLPLLLHAHTLAAQSDSRALLQAQQLAQAARPVVEWRLAGARTGRSLLATVVEYLPDPLLLHLLDQAAGTSAGIQLPIAFGAAAGCLGCPADQSAQAYAFSAAAGQLAAAVRLGLIGQRAVQRILHRLKPALLSAVTSAAAVPLTAIGGSLPLLEIAGMRHECAEERLFAS
ncbi:MAG TPA: urease accessory UreF family protein [Chloroflexota bacterium]|nr:urease accessory UreF family protein [Chloroflexota bacterium]